MSNVALRMRRTVPVDELDDSSASCRLSADYTREPSSLSANTNPEYAAPWQTSSLPSEPQSQSSTTSRHASSSGVGGASSHSRISHKSRASSAGGSRSLGDRPRKARSMVSTTSSSSSSTSSSDGYRGEGNQRGPTLNALMPGKPVPQTPSNRSSSKAERLTIGQSSGLGSSRMFVLPLHQRESMASSSSPHPLSSTMPDLFILEQAFSEYGEGAGHPDGIERLIRNQMMHCQHELPPVTPQGQDSNQTKAPVTWKTPFEVDAPGDTPSSKSSSRRSPHLTFSNTSEHIVDPQLSEEQYAWAGIDELLETRSLDDSYAFSTSDILPSSTVKAMRKDGSVRSFDVTNSSDDMSEFSDGMPVLTLRNKKKGHRKGSRLESGMPSLIEASDRDDDSDGKAAAENNGNQNGNSASFGEGGGGGGTLFDVFQWSEKDNVDETKQRKKKLNQTRRVTILERQSAHGPTNYEHDEASLPSLNSFRDDELSTRSRTSHCPSMHDKGSVVTADFHKVQQELYRGRLKIKTVPSPELGDSPALAIDAFKQAPPPSSSSSMAHDGLVLDKQVEDYIKRIQEQLPTISEDRSPSKAARKNSVVEYRVKDNTPYPTRIVPDESLYDELHSFFASPSLVQPTARRNGRKEEKPEPKPSLSAQLMSSIKKMRTKTGASGGGIAGATSRTNNSSNRAPVKNGDEEKYFPDTAKLDKSRLFSANRCLLNSGGDGVNWDAD